MSTELTERQGKRLAQLEAIVDQNQIGFIAAGEALLEIRDTRLYMASHQNFADYVLARFGWTDRHARRLMSAAGTDDSVRSHGSGDQPKLTTERQARALAKVPKRQRKAVLADAGDEPTEKSIAKAAAKSEAADDPKVKPKVAAAMGEAVEFDELMSMVMATRKRLTALQETKLGAHLTQQVGIDLKNVWHALKFARPYGPCGYCNQRGCKACKGEGWWPRGIYEQAPKDLQ